jgi:hypothetical protein
MRKPLLAVAVALFVAACSDGPVGPPNPLETAPTIQASHVDWLAGESTADDLCGGLSPCDAYDYDRDGDGVRDGVTGVPGFCFLSPMVGNHLSDPACSAPFIPGLNGVFKLAWCEVSYSSLSQPSAPTLVSCQDPSEWQDLVQDGSQEFYSASVRWRRPDVGKTFRLYVVRGDFHFAHRDVIVDPNLTRPADDFLHAIGTGTEPVKVRITESFECVYFDTQDSGTENAATCLISGETSFGFVTDDLSTTFNFPNGNPTFLADFEVSECLSLGFSVDAFGAVSGNALVDTPLAGCKVSLSSEELETLPVPAQIVLDLLETSPFPANARPNVLQYDEFGVGALPPSENPGWFGAATSSSAMLRLLDWGVDRLRALASFLGPQPLYAWPGSGWDFTRLSDFQIAWMPVMDHGNDGVACASGLPSCLDLGSFPGTSPVPVTVEVTAPSVTASDPALDVPGTRLHVFPESGTVACPAVPAPGQQCYPAGTPDNSTTPASLWGHLVVITGSDGRGVVDWTLDGGDNTLRVSACGVARPGANEPDPPTEPGGDGVWGTLGDCTNRAAFTAPGAFDNGPADGHTPFEPVDVLNEVAIYGLPLVFEAATCPEITINGTKGAGEWACAEKTGFIAPVKGPQPTSDNAWLYTYNDGDALYVALEVVNNELGNRMFINLVDQLASGSLAPAADDDILILEFPSSTGPGVAQDWFYTQSCVGNSSSSLCGAPDVEADLPGFALQAAAQLGGAGSGRVFYEFKRPFNADENQPADEDLDALPGDLMGLKVTLTQGQGGGKGGFVYPDPKTGPTYHQITLD